MPVLGIGAAAKGEHSVGGSNRLGMRRAIGSCVTGFGSPGQSLVELELRLGLGERLCFLFPCRWVSCDRAANAQAMEGLGWYASEAG